MTWSRRYFSGSAWGSSRVLMIGRECIVSRPTSVSRKSARCEIGGDARGVGHDVVEEAPLLVGRGLFLLHVLDAARLAQRTVVLLVPAHAGGPVRLVGVDEQERREDRVEVRLVLGRDPVLGLE